MLIRPIETEDMLEVSEWFSRRKWPMPPVDQILPRTGFIAISNSGKKLAVAWIYLTNSSMAFIEWTATNPDEPMSGMRALNKIFTHVKETSKNSVKVLMQFVANKKLESWLTKHQAFKKNRRSYFNGLDEGRITWQSEQQQL